MAAREYSATIADGQGNQLPREDSRALLGFHSCLYRQQVISLRQIQLSGFSPVQVASPCKLRLYAVPDGEVEQSICCQALRIIRRSMRTCDDAPVPAHLQAYLQVRFLFTRSPATSDDWGGRGALGLYLPVQKLPGPNRGRLAASIRGRTYRLHSTDSAGPQYHDSRPLPESVPDGTELHFWQLLCSPPPLLFRSRAACHNT